MYVFVLLIVLCFVRLKIKAVSTWALVKDILGQIS